MDDRELREDLRLEERAMLEGFRVIRTSHGNPLMFSKGQMYVWECAHKGRPAWAAARLDGGVYKHHTYHETLRAALDHVNIMESPDGRKAVLLAAKKAIEAEGISR